MRCEEAQQALSDARYDGGKLAADVRAHVTGCSACAQAERAQRALERVLASAEPAVVGPGFDTRFFAKLEHERMRARRKRWIAIGAALVPIAAAAALMLMRAPEPKIAAVPVDDVELALDLELVEDIAVVEHLDEIEAYEELGELDPAELERALKESE